MPASLYMNNKNGTCETHMSIAKVMKNGARCVAVDGSLTVDLLTPI